MGSRYSDDWAFYSECGKKLAILSEISQSFKQFTVPSIVFSNDGEIIKVIGISR